MSTKKEELLDFISPHPGLLGNCSMHGPTTYVPVGVPEGEGILFFFDE